MFALCQLICASLVIITAQNEEIFYYSGFEAQLDWIEDNGTYDPAIHTFIPIQWRSSISCPRAVAGETSTDATTCVQTKKDASISRFISTVGFHSIRLQIDVKASDVDSFDDDWCIIQYRTATKYWINTNIIREYNYVLNYDVFIPDNNAYNDQDSFQVKIGTAANSGPDNCYFDNLKLFGTPYTETPTSDTSDPTKNPSRSPLVEPTLYPTKHPSYLPTESPTSQPTLSPSVDPTTAPTFFPVYAETAAILSQSKAVEYTKNKEIYSFWLMVFLGIMCCICVVAIIVMFLCLIQPKKEHQKDVNIIAAESVKKEAIVLESADNEVKCEVNEENVLNVAKTRGNIAPDEFEVIADDEVNAGHDQTIR